MKTSKVGIVAVAILLIGTGIGFGIAQAGVTHTDRPVLSFEDQEAFEQGNSSSPDAENRPVLSFEDQELPHVAKSPSEDMQLESPIETGSLSTENVDFDPFSRSEDVQANSSIVEIEGNMYYRVGGKLYGPY